MTATPTGQSLAKGAAGIALLHIERARTGIADWDTAHHWLTDAATGNVNAGDGTGLFYGATSLAFALEAAGPGRYERPRAHLLAHTEALAHRRLDRAEVRLRRRELPGLEEFDLIYGLTGIGAHLLRAAPGSDALGRTLAHLVRLTEPLRLDGQHVPGWWTGHDPHFRQPPAFPNGHANLGMAHGITGPLALLALSLRDGVEVHGHRDAIGRICAWLDDWQQDTDGIPWWPQWINFEEVRSRRIAHRGPFRPSWCYGTPGIARAQQLAALATGDIHRQHLAENAIAACLSDTDQLDQLTDSSLCHGWAGLFQTVWRASQDATESPLAMRLPHLRDVLIQQERSFGDDGPGYLEGHAGLLLALHTAHHSSPQSGWDTSLLLA
ncbi:lanthionine synthetase C family protein [Kitasatospora sp. NPDC051914]|uniref:lanthionine synthetase C family protein n=1 Tax=Kitasatospora sp. NPDC051914 TaxID=3154945 RepID=UPI00342F094F